MTFTVVFALATAFSNAVNLMTQHSASAGAPKREKGWRLVGYLFRQPLWLLGWIAAVGGFAFQAVALHYGQLSVVQPILDTELVFVLVLRRVWIRQDVARAAWAAVLVVCGALAVFLAVAEPTGGHLTPETAEWLSALLVFGGVMALLAVLGMQGSPTRRTALFAVAAALAWALMATFLKTATETLTTSGISGHAHALAGVRPCRRRGNRHAARAGRSPRRAVERISAASGHHQPARQHHLEHLAVRRALHRQPGEDRHGRRGHGDPGRRGHRAVTNGAERPHPLQTGHHVSGAHGVHLRSLPPTRRLTRVCGIYVQEHAKRRVARRRGTCDRVEGRRWQRDAAGSCGRRAGR